MGGIPSPDSLIDRDSERTRRRAGGQSTATLKGGEGGAKGGGGVTGPSSLRALRADENKDSDDTVEFADENGRYTCISVC
jgi:hypothetical protein